MIYKAVAATILLINLIGLTVNGLPCALRTTQHGSVCVCNTTYCDYLVNPTVQQMQEFVIVSSTKAGLRFQVNRGRFNVFSKFHILDYDQIFPATSEIINSKADTTRTVRLEINREQTFQQMIGFGGSFTGAVSYLVNNLPLTVQEHLFKSYYSLDGIGFSVMRISIGGCDFDLEPWAYNEYPENDFNLTNFNLDPRDAEKIRQIKQLIEVANVKNLKIKGAAWSSPPWMKTNNAWTGSSRLRREFYETWANYHLKWLDMMQDNGLPIWAISTGNEPLNGVFFMYFVKFMSLGWTPTSQAIWLADYLGPTIRNSKHKNIIIFGNDDQRYTFPTWFNMMKAVRKNSVDFLDGLAYHWYWDEIFGPSNLNTTIQQIPNKITMVTESCIGDKPWQFAGPDLGSWERGEKYARDILENIQYGLQGWIDWNLILDTGGGPNYANNFVDAPVIVNLTNPEEILKQPMFYTIGHFSKFIPEGSVRISAVRSNININAVAFLRPDSTVCVLIFNSGRAKVDVNIIDSERGVVVINIPPKSIHSVVYK